MNGQLSAQPLAEVIREISATGLSGALRLTRERVRAVIYAQDGALIYARSNLRAHRLTECLRRWGFLTAEQLTTFAGTTAEADVCAALVAARVLTEGALPGLRVRQTADVLRPLLLWTEGAWDYDPRARLAEAGAGVVASNELLTELLLESARRLPAEFAAARLADADLLAPMIAPSAQLTLLPTEAFILSRVDMPLKLADLVAISGLPETQTRHTIYALALAGLLTRAVWPPMFAERTLVTAARTVATAEPPGAQVAAPDALKAAPTIEPTLEVEPDPQAEIAALLARVRGADNYQTLGVARTAAAGEIKRAYYALAKRFHPDRFRRAVDDAQRKHVETAFAQIAQAYETLSDDKARAAYDLKLPTESVKASTAAAPALVQTPAPGASQAVKQASAEENFQHGLTALKHDNPRMAVAYLVEAVRLAPQQARYHAYYGRALAHDARTRRQAEVELQAAITLDPVNATHHVMLAELYHLLGHTRRAEGQLIRALGHDPHHIGARQLLDQIKRQ